MSTFFPNISKFDQSKPDYQALPNKNLVWPNQPNFYNSSLIDLKVDPFGGVVIPFGFLVPTKGKGGLYYYPFSKEDRSVIGTSEPILLTRDNEEDIEWFYHRVRFIDLNGDGRDDLLTCRTEKPIFGSTKTELVSFVFNANTKGYDEKVIMKSACDVFFDTADIDKDGRFEIVSAGFFISQLNVIYSEDPNNNFLNGNVKVKTIDANAGQLFEVIIEDLDNQGNLELLATNHQGNNAEVKGALFYYTLSGNVRTGKWSKNIFHDDFPVLKGGFNQAAPGAPVLFHPNLNRKERLHIILAGDGSEYAYHFAPSAVTEELSYSLVWSQLYSDTVGGIDVADVNGDGITDCIIPIYEKNVLYFYSYNP